MRQVELREIYEPGEGVDVYVGDGVIVQVERLQRGEIDERARRQLSQLIRLEMKDGGLQRNAARNLFEIFAAARRPHSTVD